MTAPAKRSRGEEHSRKIKQSAGWARYQAELAQRRMQPPPTAWSEAEHTQATARAELAANRRKLTPSPAAFLMACNFDLSGIRKQLKKAFRDGYVRALLDVKRERERMERAAYFDSLPRTTPQDMAEIRKQNTRQPAAD